MREFKCQSCGAGIHYEPGTDQLKCPFCGKENPIPKGEAGVEEQNLEEELARVGEEGVVGEVLVVRCEACGAKTTFPPNVTADKCAFCGSPLVTGKSLSQKKVQPHGILPFLVDSQKANQSFARWIGSRWFAPNDLKRHSKNPSNLKGVYTPYWTFDSQTDSPYTGERGDDYWTTEAVSVVRNGRQCIENRRVKHTRWTPTSGRVEHFFDDVLVPASNNLPRKYMEALEPWDLSQVVPYEESYLSGFRVESYSLPLPEGRGLAREKMAQEIRRLVERDIGGDHQRVFQIDTSYSQETFKHLLMPIWIDSYRYGEKVYRFLVNARTGEVQGERPWSVVKIVFAVLVAVAVLVLLLTVVGGN